MNGVTLDFSRPGKPTDNSFIEAFNGKVRAECIDQNWFLSLADAHVKCEAFRHEYNTQPAQLHRQQDLNGVHEIHRSLQPADGVIGREIPPLAVQRSGQVQANHELTFAPDQSLGLITIVVPVLIRPRTSSLRVQSR